MLENITEGRGFESQPGQVDFSLLVRYGSSLGETPNYYAGYVTKLFKTVYTCVWCVVCVSHK